MSLHKAGTAPILIKSEQDIFPRLNRSEREAEQLRLQTDLSAIHITVVLWQKREVPCLYN